MFLVLNGMLSLRFVRIAVNGYLSMSWRSICVLNCLILNGRNKRLLQKRDKWLQIWEVLMLLGMLNDLLNGVAQMIPIQRDRSHIWIDRPGVEIVDAKMLGNA